MTNFYYLYGYLPYRYFYFKKSLRTSTATTTVRTTFTRLVTLTTSTTMYPTIPAGYLYQEKNNFRSPYIDGDDYVYFVDSTEGGYVNFHNITNGIFKVSYGRSSPSIHVINYASNISSDGVVGLDYHVVGWDSCGVK